MFQGSDARAAVPPVELAPELERRGRTWLLWSFLFCPCHLPLSLAVLAAVLGGTSVGVALSDHMWVAGAVITTAWVLGTGYGFRLIRRADQANGACPVGPGRANPRWRRRVAVPGRRPPG